MLGAISFLEVVDVGVLALHIQAGTGLVDVGQIAVADDLSLGVGQLQTLQEVVEGGLLRRCTGILVATLRVETTFVTDANGVLVVVAGMGSSHFLRTTEMDFSIAGYIVVVAATGIAFGSMTAVEVFEAEGLITARCAAVQHDQLHFEHRKHLVLLHLLKAD